MTDNQSSTQTLAREAMGTVFTLTIAHPDQEYARQAAHAALEELDLLEDRLSRFRPSGDIGRVNRLCRGEKTTVAPETLACLQLALAIGRETNRAFDVAYASGQLSGIAAIELDTDKSSVRASADRLRLDLGGIGKGFALDRMAAVLAEWDITAALAWASTSTVLAKGTPPNRATWSVSIGPEHARRQIPLTDAAISASGTSTQGPHIVDPRFGRRAQGRTRCWAWAPTAAEADALSTAFMVMSDAEIASYCKLHPHVSLCTTDARDLGVP